MNVLPDSRARRTRGSVRHRSANWIPIYCANCGTDGGMVPEDNREFAFYLCQKCADSLPPIEGTYVTPDEVFWQKVHAEQIEKYGRILSPGEIAVELEDPMSTLSKLKKDREKENSFAFRL